MGPSADSLVARPAFVKLFLSKILPITDFDCTGFGHKIWALGVKALGIKFQSKLIHNVFVIKQSWNSQTDPKLTIYQNREVLLMSLKFHEESLRYWLWRMKDRNGQLWLRLVFDGEGCVDVRFHGCRVVLRCSFTGLWLWCFEENECLIIML